MEKSIPQMEEIIEKMVKDPACYAAIYARQSSPTEKFSLSDQISLGKDYADKNNLIVYDVYSEKISASSRPMEKRKMFQQLLRDAEAGHFKTVIAARRDRLARNVEEFFEIKKIFAKAGIRLAYSNDGEYQSDDSYISGFIENVVMAVAELEPEQIKMRIRSGKKRQKEEKIYSANWAEKLGLRRSQKKINKVGNPPIHCYTYNRTGCADRIDKIFKEFLAIDDSKIENIKQAFELLRQNNSKLYSGLSNIELRDIISNPIYAGLDTKSFDYKYDRNSISIIDKEGNIYEVVLEYFHQCVNVTAIICSNDWLKAVEKLKRLITPKERKRNHKSTYLFDGMLFCSKCGSKIELKGNKYSCINKCINISREKFIVSVLPQFLSELLHVKNLKLAIDRITAHFRKEVASLRMKLANYITEQEGYIRKYLDYPDDENNNNRLIELQELYESLREEIRGNEEYVAYLNKEFLYSVIFLMDTKPGLAINYITSDEGRLQDLISKVYDRELYVSNGTDGIIIEYDNYTEKRSSSRIHKSIK